MSRTVLWSVPVLGGLLLTWLLIGYSKPVIGAHPQVAMYSSWHGMSAREQARWDFVILEPARYSPKADSLRLMRKLNRKLVLLAYVQGGRFFVCGPGWQGGPLVPGCDTTTQAWATYSAVRATDGFLWDVSGKPFNGGGYIDFSKPGVAEALADTFAAWSAASGAFSGIFTDGPCYSMLWEAAGVDYARSGYASLAQWDSAFSVGVGRYFKRLRLNVGTGYVVGNCGPIGPATANGWMAENFPHQNPVGWGAWHDVLNDADTIYTAPRLSWITTARYGREPDDPSLKRDWRFGLASACMHDNVVHALVGTGFDPLRGYLPWWCEEFSVDRSGNADSTGRNRGWLGRPLGSARPQGACWRRDFYGGCVLVNPTDIPAMVTLGRGFYRIRGTGANPGEQVSVVLIPPKDGLFLQRR